MQWLMLQQDQPEDDDIATGRQYSVREFVDLAATELGMEIRWEGEGVNGRGIDTRTGKTLVAFGPEYFSGPDLVSIDIRRSTLTLI